MITTTKRIVATTIALLSLLPIAGAQASSSPPPPAPPANLGPVKPFVAKWILPPRTSSFYESEKAFAQSMGYETVEHDDFSYPGPRVP
jgi:hypothetical protein